LASSVRKDGAGGQGRAANRSRRRPAADGPTYIQPYYYMKGKPTNGPEQEPIGIVISRGSRQEDLPRVFAYVWGPAPETSEEPRETKVA
jgi:hypothetical protein